MSSEAAAATTKRDKTEATFVLDRKGGDEERKLSYRERKKQRKDGARKRQSWDESNENDDKPHLGSYANAGLRELLGLELPDHAAEAAADAEKRTKKKVVILLGYLGTNYSGFQMNDGQRTLQADLEWALLDCHYLTVRNFGYPHKYSWSTSGRTDKGVHACSQVVSLKVELLPSEFEDLTKVRDELQGSLNKLPKQEMKVLDVVRTTKGFCAKTQRDRVRYQYMLPSYVLYPQDELRALFQECGCCNGGRRDANDPLSQKQVQQLQQSKLHNFKCPPERLQLLRNALQIYEGTHSFHNFTKRIDAGESRASRYMVSFQADDPLTIDGVEWICTRVVGQSFLLHQIRKMIGLAIDVARGAAPLVTIETALDKEPMRLNVAPAQGLFLEMSFYRGYNRRRQQHVQDNNRDMVDIDWDSPDNPAHATWQAFKSHVEQSIVQQEVREGNFLKHLYMQEYIFDYKHFYRLHDKAKEAPASNDVSDQQKD